MGRFAAELGDTTIKTLFGLSNNMCAYRDPNSNHPACEEKLVDPAWKQVNAMICHIRAASPGGPRYDPAMTDEERAHFDNLILLCPNHHRRVDNLEPENYSMEMLQKMKLDSMIDTVWASDALLDRAARALLLTMEREHAAGRLPDTNMGEESGEASNRPTTSSSAGAGLGGTYLGGAPLGGAASGSVSVDASVSRSGESIEVTDSRPLAQESASAHDTAYSFDSIGVAPTESDDLDGGRRAAKIQVMLNAKGYPEAEVNRWWNTPSESLHGATPTFVWLRHNQGDRETVEAFAYAMPPFSLQS